MLTKAKHDIPRFISIEGGDGAGKTTLMDNLSEFLISSKMEVFRTREPGGTLFGEEIRRLLLSPSVEFKIGQKAELLLFLAARAEHIEEKIAPALDSGKIVICDRFNDSTIAYQGIGRDLGEDFVRNLCQIVSGKTIPDLTFYLDVDPKIGIERARIASKNDSGAGTLDRIEKEHLSFHEKIREAFISFAKLEPKRFFCIDANQPKEKVWEEVKKVLTSLYSTRSLYV